MDKNMTESTQGIANLPQGIANLPQGIANLPQGMSESNIIAEIKRDHEEMKTYYTNFKNATTVEESNKWFNQFVLETSRHSVGEELVLYPLMEKLSQKGKDLADAGRKDHHEAKELLYAASKEKDPVAFDAKMEEIMKDLLQHMEKEEKEDLVYVQDSVPEKDLVHAGKMYSLKKKIVPTRPHPAIPEKPVALEAALGLLVAPLDKFKDLFSSFPDKSEV